MTAERPADDLPYHAVASRVFWSQVLWTAGYSLTTGPFLSYSARTWEPRAASSRCC